VLRSLGISLLLAAVTAGVYAGVREHEFVDFDDLTVIVRNPDLRPESLGDAVTRAFSANLAGNWIPATVLSLQATSTLAGDAAAGFLLGNLALHALASVVLFLALARLTGAVWESAFVAAVFALHPLHVESVAWAAMRKDTLAGLGFALTLLTYAHYVERPNGVRYAAVSLALVLGLLAKPVVVTLPCVLLLLDAWPLGRLRRGATRRRALVEKLPWFALAALTSVATWQAQAASGALVETELVPLGQRLANALDSLAIYVQKSFWPTQLAVFYPHPGDSLGAGRLASAAALVGAISLMALMFARTRTYLLVGWLWFVGMLVPVLGLVQVGNQARADRYTYLPLIGLAVAVTWGASAIVGRSRSGRAGLAMAGGIALVALAATSHAQLAHWRDSVALHARAVEVAPGSAASQQRLGEALLRTGNVEAATHRIERAVALSPRRGWAYLTLADLRARAGRLDLAIPLYERGLRIETDDARGHANLGLALSRLERHDEARAPLERALELHREAPQRSELSGAKLAAPHAALADVLARSGELAAAIEHYRHALALDATRERARGNLGLALSRAGRFAEARPLLEEALAFDRLNAELQAGMGRTFSGLGRPGDAARHFRNALKLRPGWRHASNDLAWLLATTWKAEVRNPEEAVRLIATALLDEEYQPAMLDTLAAALAADGRFDEAVSAADRALERTRHDPELAEEIRARRTRYARGEAYVEPAPAASEPTPPVR